MERWPDCVYLIVNDGPKDEWKVRCIWGTGGPRLTAETDQAARSICDAIEELHELRAEVARLRGLQNKP